MEVEPDRPTKPRVISQAVQPLLESVRRRRWRPAACGLGYSVARSRGRGAESSDVTGSSETLAVAARRDRNRVRDQRIRVPLVGVDVVDAVGLQEGGDFVRRTASPTRSGTATCCGAHLKNVFGTCQRQICADLAAEVLRLEAHRNDPSTGMGIDREQPRTSESDLLERSTRIRQPSRRAATAGSLQEIDGDRWVFVRTECCSSRKPVATPSSSWRPQRIARADRESRAACHA